MKEMAIIGSAGRMGSWFARYFARRGLHVTAYDLNKKMPKISGVNIADSIAGCVKDANFVLVSVPVRATPKVIKECVKYMKQDAVISEISSVKRDTLSALRHAPRSVKPLCIHPMFGPGAGEKMQPRILLVPVRNEEAELKITRDLFENAAIKVLPGANAHDRSIATVLGLTYFANIVFAKVMSAGNVPLLKQVSGTTFGLQSLIAESIMASDPDLVVALVQDNPYTRKYIRQYLNAASAVAVMASAKDGRRLKADLKKTRSRLQKSQDLEQSYRKMYDIIENIR
jgi:prephenate dehydrogenase